MSSEWPTVRLGDYVDSSLGKMLDAKKNKGTPQPYLGNSNVRWGEFDLTDLAKMRFESDEEERYGLCPGDLVVCEGGEPGRCAIWNGPPGMKFQKALHRIRPKPPLDIHYLFNWFRHAARTGQLDAHFTGTTIKHLTGKAVAELRVQLPPLSEQKAVVDVLKPLDDRITLLRETNTTLETIAQALFKSWFVDFDPVRARQQGLAPEGMDEATAALFPDGFEESELGLVPSGWDISPVYSLAEYVNGAAYKAFQPNNDGRGLPIIKIAELKSGVTTQTAFSDAAMPEKYRIKTRDILFSWSGNPDTSIDTFVWPHDEAWLNQHIFRVLPASVAERSFVLQTLRYLKPVFAELARNKQTTGLGHVTVSDLKQLRVVKPPMQLLRRWSEVIDPLLDQAFVVQRHAQTLSTLRDTLLPRLISGRLRLPDAQAELEGALP